MNLPMDTLFEYAHGDKWLKEMSLAEFPGDVNCVVCRRSAGTWPIKNTGTLRDKEALCTSCSLFAEGSFELLGIDSVRSTTHADADGRKITDPHPKTAGFGFDLRRMKPTAEEIICDDCEKSSSTWDVPNRGISYKVDGVKKRTCLSCYAPYEMRLGLLNNKRVFGTSFLVPAKLGMLAGCAVLATKEKTILGLNHSADKKKITGWFSKVQAAPNCPYEIVPLARLDFLAYISTLKIAPPFVYIDEIEKDNDPLIHNIVLSQRIEETYACNNKERRVLDLTRVKAVVDLIENVAVKEYKDDFNEIYKKLVSNKPIDCEVKNKPFIKRLLSIFPDSPWQAIELLNIARRN